MFGGCSSLTSLDLSSWDVSSAIGMDSMSGMFSGCTSLQNLNVSNWEVNADSLTDIFQGCRSLTSLDLSTWKVNNLTSLSWTFARCSSLTSLDLSTWDVSSVTSMGYTFGECSSLQTLNLSTWNTRNVTETYSVFDGVPSSVDWCYDGTNYSNFSLTEEQTGFNGTFPWESSQPEEPSGTAIVTVHYHHPNGEYGTGEWVSFNKVNDEGYGSGSDIHSSSDDFGYSTTIEVDTNAAYNISFSYQGTDFATGEFTFTEDTELWVIYGDSTIYTQKPESGWTPAKPVLIINYQDPYDPYNNPYVELSLNEHNENPIQCALNSTNDFGQYGQVELEFNQTYWITYYNNGILIGTCPSTITMDSNKEIWIVRPEDYVTERPGSGEGYIQSFTVSQSELVFDASDRQSYDLWITPDSVGKQISFTYRLENAEFETADAFNVYFYTDNYINGNNEVQGYIGLNNSSILGSATLIIREENSGYEQSISISIEEPQPVITDFTISPESLTFSDDGTKTATVTVIPAETDRTVRFYESISAYSSFNITRDESEAPNKYYFHIEATQLYKEEYEPTFSVYEERSGINKSIPITIDSENIWVNPQANVKVYYNREDGNYDNAYLSYNISSESVSGSTGFYYSDDNGQYADQWILKGQEVELRVFNGYDPEDGSELVVASGTFTFTEDTTLWLVEGESTIYTEKPSLDDEGTPEEPTDTPEGNDTPTEEPDTPEGGGTEEPTPEEGEEIIEGE